MTAYDETYLDDAMNVLGEAVDYAVNECGISLEEFFDLFIMTGYAAQFEVGVPAVVSGMTGVELAGRVLNTSGLKNDSPSPRKAYGRSPEYWCGWILAYFQWRLNRSFKTIFHYLPSEKILQRYPTLHEASEEKCVDAFLRLMHTRRLPSRLQQQRKTCGLSQRELSERAEINLRTLQQYETRAKDLEKASFQTVRRLSRALHCSAEDILDAPSTRSSTTTRLMM